MLQDYQHFYGQGGAPTTTKKCPLWSNMDLLHGQELALAAKKAKEELAADNLSLKYDPTKGIPEPVAGGAGAGGLTPDVADVIAPGLPRDELFRQQRYIEELILRGHPHHHHHRHGAAAGIFGGPPGNPPHHHHPQVADMQHMMLRMREILRMREEGRQQHRLARQAELAALRDLGAQPWLPPQPPAPPAPAVPVLAQPPQLDALMHRHLMRGPLPPPPPPPPPPQQHIHIQHQLDMPHHPIEIQQRPHNHQHHHHHHRHYPGQLAPPPAVWLPPQPQQFPYRHMVAMPPVLNGQPAGPPEQRQFAPPLAAAAADREVDEHLRLLWGRDRRLRHQHQQQQQQQPRLEGEVNVERVPNDYGVPRVPHEYGAPRK